MEIWRNIFGTLSSGIVRLLVTVGVLAAAYFFIVKPVLHTTDEAIKSSGINDIGKTIRSVNREVQQQIRHSFKVTKQNGGDPQKLLHCIQRANGNVNRMQRCTRRF
jgi:sensor domain CHASE-containing protein